MRILVTRPEPDATELARRLKRLGHDPLVEPLLIAEPEPLDDLEFEAVHALIATSRNAIRALSTMRDIDQALDTPIYVVGPGTAAAARALGFRAVMEGPRAARELVAQIARAADVNGGPLMHLAGNLKAYDVAGELRRLGFHVLEPTVYTVRPAPRLGAGTITAIETGEIDAVLLFSPATARIWTKLANAHGLSAHVLAIRHFCLSPAVVQALGDPSPIDVACAIQPNLEQMLALLARAAPQSQ